MQICETAAREQLNNQRGGGKPRKTPGKIPLRIEYPEEEKK